MDPLNLDSLQLLYETPADGGSGGVGDSQGTETDNSGSENGFYDLSTVPEDQRQYVEPILQQVQSNVGKKLEEHANYRKQWEPYEELGVNNIDPELMEELVTISNIVDDDEALQQWWEGLGKERGWYEDQAVEAGLDDDDDDFDEDEDLTQEDIDAFREVISNAIEEKTAPLYEAQREREQQEAMAKAGQEIDAQLAELKDKHGDFDEKAVCKLALGYDGPDAIEKGFKDYQEIVNQSENGVFESKSEAPVPPEGPGKADTTPKAITTFKEADAAARERIKANNQA